MTGRAMPPAEVDVTVDLVRSLLAHQRPDLADESLTGLAHGWDNELFRIGDSMVGRFPRRSLASKLVENEARWLPTFTDRLPLPIPAPFFLGEPGHGYPWRWVLSPWIDGESAATATSLDLTECARQLGAFLRALHRPAPADAPANPFRGVPLVDRDEAMRQRIDSLESVIDTRAALEVWETALAADVHRGPAVWLHGDVHPLNLLVMDGRLSGVVDFGDVTAGDPATDLAAAWTMFGPSRRQIFFDEYGGPDEACRTRARAWALAFAAAYLANSADNPIMYSIGERAYTEVVGEG
ncbi:MAG: aminoglycoside phosphotransferase family protein [Acidimicrobiia bacterium]|jgi:aminoglycoside phosphotransferase (APT) family kinase protein